MIFKKFKFILSIVIICSIFLNSGVFATNTVDSGAFVTKSEFDKALSDFNDRMNAFETGINSKIDSQVASYLDRNGIWAPVKQSIINANSKWKYGFFCDSTYIPKYVLNPTNVITSNKCIVETDGSNKGHIAIYDNKENMILVENITKSGLAVINTKCSNSVDNNPQCFIGSVSSTATGLESGDFYFSYRAEIEFIQQAEVLNSVSYALNMQMGGAYLQAPPIPASVLVFFVNKNFPLYISYKNTLQRDNGSATACSLVFHYTTTGSNPTGSYREWSVEDINVY